MPGDTETGATSRTGLRSGGGIDAESNIKMWERLTKVIEEAFTHLETWVKDTAYPNMQELTLFIGKDLTSVDHLWKTMEQVD